MSLHAQAPPILPAPERSLPPPEALRDYVIGPQDLLLVTIFESPDLSREVRVSADGTIGMPLLASRVRVQGLMLSEAEALLARMYQEGEILKRPNITFMVKDLQSKPVTVMGAVRSPGVFQVSGQTRLLRVLTQAGGASDDAGNEVQVIRAGATSQEEIVTVSLEDLRAGTLIANVPVFGGDTVNVRPAGAVYVLGAINHPGKHLLQGSVDQLTVLRVVALAGDLTRTAKPDRSVIIRKTAAVDELQQIPVDIRKILERKQPDVVLQANDVLYIPDSAAKRAFRRGLETALQVATGLVIVGAR